jgi:hypothetical protein
VSHVENYRLVSKAITNVNETFRKGTEPQVAFQSTFESIVRLTKYMGDDAFGKQLNRSFFYILRP